MLAWRSLEGGGGQRKDVLSVRRPGCLRGYLGQTAVAGLPSISAPWDRSGSHLQTSIPGRVSLTLDTAKGQDIVKI